ncbi:MAG: zinc ribbon domain-containing protein [Planctomycetota bacterium]
MPIAFSCSCGHTLRVPDSKAGATGKCPRCAATVRVPSTALASANGNGDAFAGLFEKFSSEPAPLEVEGESAERSHTKSVPPCPKCGTQYEPDVVVCIACGFNLVTGQPLGMGSPDEPFRPRRAIVRNDSEEAESMGFWKMTLGVLLKPLQTLELFGAIFSRQDMLAKGVIFYAASFVAVGLAAAFAARPDRNAEVQNQIEQIERLQNVEHHVPQEWMDVKLGAQGLTEWGEPLSLKVIEPVGPVEAGKPFMVRMLVMEPDRSRPAIGKAKLGRTSSHGNPPGNEWHDMKTGTKEGEYVVQLPATRQGGSSFAFSITCRPGTQAGDLNCSRCNVHITWSHLPGWGQLVVDDRTTAIAEAARAHGLPVADNSPKHGLVSAALGTAGTVAAIAGNVIGLLISAAIFTFAARLLGGGGGFTLMLVTMAYLTGFSNFLQFLSLLTPLKLQMWLQVGLLFYGLGLQLFALMKVYDIDVLQALMTALVGFAAKLFGAAFIVLAALKILGMA